ncbi:MAG: hypothetical protein WAT81_04625, partial [Candidatus Moraniibacteriota bacterium]
MKTFRIVGLLFAAFLAATNPVASQAQANNLVATSWLVTIDGETKTRTLQIASATPTSDGALLLEATYGLTSGGMYPAQAQMNQGSGQRQLTLVTAANSTIIATEQSDGSFRGTFSPKHGGAKSVVISGLNSDLQIAAKTLASEQLVPLGVNRWANRPKFFVGDTWQFEFANKRYAKPGCEYRLSVERVTSSNVYARAAFPDGCEVSITTAYPIGQGSLQKFDLGLNHYHYSTDPYPAFDFPLYVGKVWTRKWQSKIN